MKISSKIIEVLCFDTLFLENEIEKKNIRIYCDLLQTSGIIQLFRTLLTKNFLKIYKTFTVRLS